MKDIVYFYRPVAIDVSKIASRAGTVSDIVSCAGNRRKSLTPLGPTRVGQYALATGGS